MESVRKLSFSGLEVMGSKVEVEKLRDEELVGCLNQLRGRIVEMWDEKNSGKQFRNTAKEKLVLEHYFLEGMGELLRRREVDGGKVGSERKAWGDLRVDFYKEQGRMVREAYKRFKKGYLGLEAHERGRTPELVKKSIMNYFNKWNNALGMRLWVGRLLEEKGDRDLLLYPGMFGMRYLEEEDVEGLKGFWQLLVEHVLNEVREGKESKFLKKFIKMMEYGIMGKVCHDYLSNKSEDFIKIMSLEPWLGLVEEVMGDVERDDLGGIQGRKHVVAMGKELIRSVTKAVSMGFSFGDEERSRWKVIDLFVKKEEGVQERIFRVKMGRFMDECIKNLTNGGVILGFEGEEYMDMEPGNN